MTSSALAWLSKLRGRFLVFDGPDGSGKSTQTQRFADLARQEGLTVCQVREPGGTTIGEQVRAILLDPAHKDMTVPCELLLYMASRAQLVTESIGPALARGELVLADRFISSTLAYQGTAGGLSREDILRVGHMACGSVWPDLVVIFDVDEATAAARMDRPLDRMEGKGAAFHRRVRQGYLAQAQAEPTAHLVIDARPAPDDVFAQLLRELQQRAAAW